MPPAPAVPASCSTRIYAKLKTCLEHSSPVKVVLPCLSGFAALNKADSAWDMLYLGRCYDDCREPDVVSHTKIHNKSAFVSGSYLPLYQYT